MDAYDAEIAYTDSEVARLLKAIDRALPADDTILIVLSDHGEEFGEHGRRYHGGTLANETLRVPLMLRAPGRLPAGQRRTGPVGLVDLVPTLLELLDIEEPYPLQGRSVLAHLRHDQALPTTPLYSVADSPFTMTYKGVDKSWQPPARAVTLWPDRLLSEKKDDGRRYWLFDLSSDPGQTKDLYEATWSLESNVLGN
jgi:arylsulfatase A-like enzyme